MKKRIMTLMAGMLLLLTACGQTRDHSTSTMLPVAAVQSAAQGVAGVADKTADKAEMPQKEEKTEGSGGYAAAGRAGGDIRECGCRSGKSAYVDCCGTSIQPVLECLRQNPKLNMVYLCLDNDEAGEDACESMTEVLADMDVDVERLRPQGKDWNDDLRAKHGKAKTPTV